MVTDGKWYFTREELGKTPSIKCGIDADKELSHRQRAAKFIQDLGQRLSVTQLCINSAIVYMHRFYMFHSMTRFHRNAIASAALFLSAKVEEQLCSLEQIIIAGWTLLCSDRRLPEKTSARYLEQLEDLLFNEDVLLQTLGFDLAVEHPHTHILSCSHLIKASKDHVEASYFMASNSLHLTTMCLLYKPTVVACFCIHITSKWSNWEIQQSKDGKPWFWHIDSSVTEQQLRQITVEFLRVFDKCSTRLKRKITSKFANQSSILNNQVSPHSLVDPKKPSTSSSSSSSRPSDDYREKPEKKERDRAEHEKPRAVDIAPNASSMFITMNPLRKPHLSHSHDAQQEAVSQHEKIDLKCYDLRNKINDNRCKRSMQQEYEKYQQQQQQYNTHRDWSFGTSAQNLRKPTINRNSRDEPSSTIGRSGSSSMANEIECFEPMRSLETEPMRSLEAEPMRSLETEPMKSLETEPMGRQTSLTASKISKHDDLLSVATPDSGFGTQPSTNYRDCISPSKTARSISALLQEPLVSMPSLLLGITDFGAAETSSQQSRQRDETSNNKNLRTPRFSQVDRRDRTSVPFAEAIRRTEEKKVLPRNKEASDSSRASATTTTAETTSKVRKFADYNSEKKKNKNPKWEMANSMPSTERNVSSQDRTMLKDEASSKTLAGSEMKISMKTLRETASRRIQSSLKMEIRALDDDTRSSTTRSCASGSSRGSYRSRSGSNGSVVAPPSSKRLRIHD